MVPKRSLAAAVVTMSVLVSLLAAGCAQGRPRLVVFLGKSSRSYNTMKPVVDAVEKKYRGKVDFENVDYDNPKNKGTMEKYNVSMNPTILMINAQGQIREQYLGSVDAETLDMVVKSYIPVPGAAASKGAPPSIPKNLQY